MQKEDVRKGLEKKLELHSAGLEWRGFRKPMLKTHSFTFNLALLKQYAQIL